MSQIPRIFVIVQDKQVRDFIQIALAPQGMLLLFAESDVLIPDALSQTSPDLIVIDTALAVAPHHYLSIKQHSRWHSLPIALLRHEEHKDAWQKNREIRADEDFWLPVQAEDFIPRIRKLLDRSCEYWPCPSGKAISFKRSMLRGFVHTISNTLTSNMLALATGFHEEQTLCLQNVTYLHHIFDLIAPGLPEDVRTTVLEYFHRIDQNEETLDRVIRLVNDANERAISHTQRVSEYAKLEYLPMQVQPLYLDQELAAVLAKYQKDFETHHITTTLSGTFQQPFFGHRPHLRALFDHVLRNAYEAFLIQTRPHMKQITATCTETDTLQRIDIRDNADGILPEHLAEVLEPFYTTRPQTHAGLGLCFAVKLASMYRGTIELESPSGEGTTARITFPTAAGTVSGRHG